MAETHDKRTETHACDCISRQAAIDVLWHSIKDEYGELQSYAEAVISDAEDAINALPFVDAVPVVRCRDCEHKDRESGFCHGRGWPMQLVPDDGFCDKGKGR